MSLKERIYSVLVVSSADRFNTALSAMLAAMKCSPVCIAKNISAAQRELNQREYDFVIINAPLPDGFGERFAVDTSLSKRTVTLILADAQVHADIRIKLIYSGVFTLAKPTSKAMFDTALGWMVSARERLRGLEKKSVSVEEKMEEIRIVNRAKWVLINALAMDEPHAHRYIEKQAMDRCISKREVANEIIKTYS